MAPFVSRAVYERECQRADLADARAIATEERYNLYLAQANERIVQADARADYLTKQLVALRKKGYELPTEHKGGRVVPPGPSPEALAERRMHDSIVESIAKDIEQMPGIDPGVARVEAQRLRDEALGKGTVL